MTAVRFFKETALPTSLEPNAFYMIAPTDSSEYVEIYVTQTDGVARRIIQDADVQAMISAAMASANTLIMVEDIAERDALTLNANAFVFVRDASADPTVDSGGATYSYRHSDTSFTKQSEAESQDIILSWDRITGRPASTPVQIDAAVGAMHTHSNKTDLDQIGRDADGNLTFSGELPATGWATESW